MNLECLTIIRTHYFRHIITWTYVMIKQCTYISSIVPSRHYFRTCIYWLTLILFKKSVEKFNTSKYKIIKINFPYLNVKFLPIPKDINIDLYISAKMMMVVLII